MSQRFEVVAVNPNDAVGGGGCLCSETKNTDCNGPFAVFYHVEMENNLSPHAVLCIQCARDFVYEVDNGEILRGGETGEPSITEALSVVELSDEENAEIERKFPDINRHAYGMLPEIPEL